MGVDGEQSLRCYLVWQSVTFDVVRDILSIVLQYIWSCSNCKGRCPNDVCSMLVCRCSDVRFTDCLKSADILTLHNVTCVPDKMTIMWINLTRSAEKGKKWLFHLQLVLCGFGGLSRKTLTEYLSNLLGPCCQCMPGRSGEYCIGPIGNKAHTWMIQRLKKEHSLSLSVIINDTTIMNSKSSVSMKFATLYAVLPSFSL